MLESIPRTPLVGDTCDAILPRATSAAFVGAIAR